MLRRNFILAGIAILLTAGCAGQGAKSFDDAKSLENVKRYEDALSLYEEAASKEPSNTDYAAALRSVRLRLAHQSVESAREQMNVSPLKYDNLRNAQGYIDKALKVDPGNIEARTMHESLKNQSDAMVKKAEASYAIGMKALDSRNWLAAMDSFREIRSYYPGYLDTSMKLSLTESNAIAYYLKEADRQKANDDVDAFIKNLEMALAIQPANQQIVAALRDAKAKNTVAIALGQAEKFAGENRWDRVLIYIKRARGLNPTNAENERINKLYSDGATKLMAKAESDLDKKSLYSAYITTMAAFDLNPKAFKGATADELRNKLISAMTAKADELEAAGFIGLALYWTECAFKVSGSQKELYQKIQGLKDKVKQRVIKKIAIMDFNPPTNNPDAGRLVTDSLLSYMTRNTSGDVKILARDILGALIKEIEFGQAGLYDIESAKKSGKLKGTDIFIFGSLLQYNVELNKEEGQKMVVAKIGVERDPNPHYTAWAIANPKPSEEERRNAPPPFVERDKTETIRYKVGSHKKTANITISFRVVDVESGEVVITKTLKSRKEATGNYSEGVESAGIPYQKLELASDTDLLEKAVDEAIADLGHQVLSRFQNLQEKYLNDAEILKKRGESEPVAEKYMDAIMAEEVKNIKSPVTEKAKRELDRLLKQVENYPI
ncbi:MAG: CsgG/HfaB family protein [Desulfuromonadaceae bacterium]|nr:CsgG/HfaB family protein [Desulfuromonadaceae bacterium]